MTLDQELVSDGNTVVWYVILLLLKFLLQSDHFADTATHQLYTHCNIKQIQPPFDYTLMVIQLKYLIYTFTYFNIYVNHGNQLTKNMRLSFTHLTSILLHSIMKYKHRDIESRRRYHLELRRHLLSCSTLNAYQKDEYPHRGRTLLKMVIMSTIKHV